MITLHGTKGTEIYLKKDKIVSVTRECFDYSRTEVVIEAKVMKSNHVVNQCYEVIESVCDIQNLLSGKISQLDINEKYREEFEKAKEECRARCPF